MSRINDNNRINLPHQLLRTSLLMTLAMAVVWILFYINTNSLMEDYALQNMEQVSGQLLRTMEESFLQMEDMTFALSSSPAVKEFTEAEDIMELTDRAASVSGIVTQFQKRIELPEQIIIFLPNGLYYRFSGDLNNTSIKRMTQTLGFGESEDAVRIRLENNDYIGTVSAINIENRRTGTLVILTGERDLLNLFEQATDNNEIEIYLCRGDTIILSTDSEASDQSAADIMTGTKYCTSARIGFTSLQLIVSYDEAGRELKVWFIVLMVVLSLVLLAFLIIFLLFWRKKFFVPIQKVISEVEQIGGQDTVMIHHTGMEHFDGLVDGINEMVLRVEQKEKEVYDARYSLKEAELKKQRALIVSLKKQISAHFTVNVLGVIKALAALGENEKAGQMCDGLSYLLRYANDGEAFISAMEEFSILQRYVDIMEIRYPDRFTVDIDIEDELEYIRIPRMLLQPILENSILHGVIDRRGTGRVHLYCLVEPDVVRFVVDDNGRGMTEKQLASLRESIAQADDGDEIEGLSHVALTNIQRRINSYYGTGYGITVESEQGKGTKVVVTLQK